MVAALDAADRLAASRMTVVTDRDAYEVLEDFRNELDNLIGRLRAQAVDIRDRAEDYLD